MKFKINKKSFSLVIFFVFLACFVSRSLHVFYGTVVLNEDQLVERNIYAKSSFSLEGGVDYDTGDLIIAEGGFAEKEIIDALEADGQLRSPDWSFKLLSDSLYCLLLLSLVWIAVEKIGYPISNFSHNLNFK